MKEEIGRTLSEFWEARTAREKTMLTWGGLALAIVIVYLVLWAPAFEGRARLRDTLPGMQRQLATMTAQANEARACRQRRFRHADRRHIARCASQIARG